MNLQEFVKNVLIEINAGLDEAREAIPRDISFTNTANARTVEFDIAVSVEKTDGASGKAGIKVLQFAEAGGDFSRESKNSTVSRVTFGVFINPMTKDENRTRSAKMREHNQGNDDWRSR